MPVSKAHASWNGDIPTGSGQFNAGNNITGGVTYKSRFEDGPGSNPEQLIAAAHASCYSMALASARYRLRQPGSCNRRRQEDRYLPTASKTLR